MSVSVEAITRAVQQSSNPQWREGAGELQGVLEDLTSSDRFPSSLEELMRYEAEQAKSLEPTVPAILIPSTDVEVSPTSADPLKALADQFKAIERPTRDDVTGYWEARWGILVAPLAEIEIAQIEMVHCDRTQREIDKLLREGKGLAIRPKGINRVYLGMMHPEIQSWVVQPGNTLTNEEPNLEGVWFDFEDTTDAPEIYAGTTEQQLREAIARQGRYGMDVDEYIVTSKDHRDRKGIDFDTGATWSRLLRSRRGGDVVSGDFRSDGFLYVGSDLDGLDRDPDLRGRSVGVKKA